MQQLHKDQILNKTAQKCPYFDKSITFSAEYFTTLRLFFYHSLFRFLLNSLSALQVTSAPSLQGKFVHKA